MTVRNVRFRHQATYMPWGIDRSMRPYVSCALAANGRHTTITALIDSGADGCRFPLSVGEDLGFNFDGSMAETSSGFGGPSFVYRRTIDLTFARRTFQVEARFDPLAHDWQVVLGRQGFFSQFLIGFEEPRQSIYFLPL